MTGVAGALGLDPDRVAALIGTLRERHETVATAESLTAGLVCAVLTDIPGASEAVSGGLVVYSTQLKATLAGVNGRALDEHGAVHPLIAGELAEGARTRCLATWGIGLTGVAGPDPQDGVPPGTVHVAVAGPDGGGGRTIQVAGDRHQVRAAAVGAALELLEVRLNRTSRRN